ncbi:hypothetical protein COCNU_09G010120 [Cocos nucifera]|uniref:Uncharacterized protein n=1 Tax=Cocos nucifera TaxID=13894 RepID=A0A8K0N7U4_COCNU|nr:hypothetical protein COCNU_09G010120 [Cocos nucifera]
MAWRSSKNLASMVLLATIAASMLTVEGAGSAVPAGKGKGNGNGKGKGALDPASTHYVVLEPREGTAQERFFCLARGRCHFKSIECPAECPQRKPKKNRVVKGCFADCSSRCETTCKHRLPSCDGYGSVCYDPRFVGGDGVMFYFHGAKGGDFALVTDDQLQINAHFIGTRPEGRPRDFTWVQALAVMFESHTLVLAARRVAKWDDGFDALALRWDGKEVDVPTDGEAEWQTRTGGGSVEGEIVREVVVERTAETNSVRVTVSGLLEMDVKVVPITEQEDRVHGYRLPPGDAFAHLETQFRFAGLTEQVEGVLGQTYRPDYVSPVKRGVAMPMMGGEDRYRTPSFLSARCASCRFHDSSQILDETATASIDIAQY